MKTFLSRLLAPVLAVLAMAVAFAAPAQAAADLTGITSAGTDIAAVGGAVFLIYVGIKLVKWIRRAL